MHFCFAGSWESWVWQLRLGRHSLHEERDVSGSQRQHQRVSRTGNGTSAGAIYCPGCGRWKSWGHRVHYKEYSSALIYRYVDRTENVMGLTPSFPSDRRQKLWNHWKRSMNFRTWVRQFKNFSKCLSSQSEWTGHYFLLTACHFG